MYERECISFSYIERSVLKRASKTVFNDRYSIWYFALGEGAGINKSLTKCEYVVSANGVFRCRIVILSAVKQTRIDLLWLTWTSTLKSIRICRPFFFQFALRYVFQASFFPSVSLYAHHGSKQVCQHGITRSCRQKSKHGSPWLEETRLINNSLLVLLIFLRNVAASTDVILFVLYVPQTFADFLCSQWCTRVHLFVAIPRVLPNWKTLTINEMHPSPIFLDNVATVDLPKHCFCFAHACSDTNRKYYLSLAGHRTMWISFFICLEWKWRVFSFRLQHPTSFWPKHHRVSILFVVIMEATMHC